jgi:transposase
VKKEHNEISVLTTEVKEPGTRRPRRNHTAQYKLEILKQADLCKGKPGAIGALVRREGLYSSALTAWRRERDSGALSAMTRSRGRKAKGGPVELELDRLKKENKNLEEELRQAHLIIEVQKKVSEILGIKIPPSSGEKP